MSAPGIPEILMILVVALLIFGPRKLPELGKSLGAGLREFRRSTQGLKEEFEGVMNETHTASVQSPAAQPQAAQPTQVQVVTAAPQVLRTQDAVPAPMAEPVISAEVAAVPKRED